MAPRERVTPEAGKVVDMSWDPITRIVGNLGIYTKIDFDNREVVSCKATETVRRSSTEAFAQDTPWHSGQQTRRPFHVDLGTPVPDVEPWRGARERGRVLE